MRGKIALLTPVLLALASWTSIAQAVDRLVPDAFLQIQAAVDSSTSGYDRVVVTAVSYSPSGVYNPFVLDKDVPIVNSSGGEIVVDAADTASYAAQVLDANAYIEGLTLQGGTSGVLYVNGCSATNCVVKDQGVSYFGGVVQLSAGASFSGSTVQATSGEGEAVLIFSTSGSGTSVSNNDIEVYLSNPQRTAAIDMLPALNQGDRARATGNHIVFTGSKQGVGITVGTGDLNIISGNTVDGAAVGVELKGVVEQAFVEYNTISGANDGVLVDQYATGTIRYNTVALASPDACGGTVTHGVLLDADYIDVYNNFLYNMEVGVGCSGRTAYLSHNIYWSDNVCGSRADCSVTDSEISVIEPILCADREGTGAYTQRIDSDAAPGNNPWGELVGSVGCGCAWGTLTRSSTVTYGEQPVVVEDVTVPEGRTLTLEGGATLKFDPDDESEGGESRTLTELLIDGTLTAGAATLTSTAESPTPLDWSGVVVRGTGSASFDGTAISGAGTAVLSRSHGTATLDDVAVDEVLTAVQASDTSEVALSGVTIGPGARWGLHVVGRATASVSGSDIQTGGTSGCAGIKVEDAGTLSSVENTSITADDIGTGVLILGGRGTLRSGTEVSHAGCGAYVEGGVLNVTEAEFHDFPDGTGLWASNGTIKMARGSIASAEWGAWVEAGGQLTLGRAAARSTGDSTQVLITDCDDVGVGIDSDEPDSLIQVRVEGGSNAYWTGIQVLPDATCEITRCSVAGGTGTGAVGILIESDADLHAPKVDGFTHYAGAGIRIDADATVVMDSVSTADALWRRPDIRGCYYGLDVTNDAGPVVRGAVIDDDTTCVHIGPVAVPDLGHDYSGEHGNNVITDASLKLAGGSTRIGGTPDVPAEQNWWGSNPPASSKIASWVDYFPYLTTDPLPPAGVEADFVEARPQPSVIRAAFPMPFSDRVQIQFAVGSAQERAEAAVYDVRGRRVRALLQGNLGYGEHVLAWDGRTDTGVRVPGGVYFVRVRVGKVENVQKLVLTH